MGTGGRLYTLIYIHTHTHTTYLHAYIHKDIRYTDTERRERKTDIATRNGREERHISKDCWRVRARVHAFLEVPIS